MLGIALSKEVIRRGAEYVGVARRNASVCFDVSDDAALSDFLRRERFDVIINTVAIIDHAACEAQPGLAYMVNSRPSSIIVNAIRRCYFVQISTDGYFTGDGSQKHNESSRVVLLNEYARTKFAAEMFALGSSESLVVRTNIVGFRNNKKATFVEWVVNSCKHEDHITLFDDYFVSSISVSLFSKALLDLIEKKTYGMINLASSEVFSKAEFIRTLVEVFGLCLKNITTGSVKKLPFHRAESLGLDVSRAEKILKYRLPTLNDVILNLKDEYFALQ
jgi:dTDP-4-dehydrorhamnose reductase